MSSRGTLQFTFMNNVEEFHALLRAMVEKKASDLFLTAGLPPCLKVHGSLLPIGIETLSPHQVRQTHSHPVTVFHRPAQVLSNPQAPVTALLQLAGSTRVLGFLMFEFHREELGDPPHP